MAFHLLEPGGQAARQRHPAGRDAEQHHLLRTPGPLDDLVGDPGQRPADLGLFQHGLAVPGDGAGVPVPGGSGLVAGRLRMRHQDLLSRLTGRALKDVGRHHATSPVDGGRRGAAGLAAGHR